MSERVQSLTESSVFFSLYPQSVRLELYCHRRNQITYDWKANQENAKPKFQRCVHTRRRQMNFDFIKLFYESLNNFCRYIIKWTNNNNNKNIDLLDWFSHLSASIKKRTGSLYSDLLSICFNVLNRLLHVARELSPLISFCCCDRLSVPAWQPDTWLCAWNKWPHSLAIHCLFKMLFSAAVQEYVLSVQCGNAAICTAPTNVPNKQTKHQNDIRQHVFGHPMIITITTTPWMQRDHVGILCVVDYSAADFVVASKWQKNTQIVTSAFCAELEQNVQR